MINVKAKSVDAENITGTTISGKTISGGTVSGATIISDTSNGKVTIDNGMITVDLKGDVWFSIHKENYTLDISPTKWGLKSIFYNDTWGWIWLDPAEVFKYLSEHGCGA